jgi:hypothetical protein
LLSGALGGLIVSVLAAGAGYYLLSPKLDIAEAQAVRLSAIESQAERNNPAIAAVEKRLTAVEGTHSVVASATLASIEKRVSALEARDSGVGLDKRLGAIEAANAEDAPKLAAAAQAVQSLTGELKDVRADVDAARGEIPALSARVAKLESGAPQEAAAAADFPAVTGRLDKIEAQLTAQKSEIRTAEKSARESPAAIVILAEAVRDKLARGAPFPAELAAMENLGVDPAKLTALKAAVDGAPTGRALAASFEAVQSKVLEAAVPPAERGGIADRFLTRLRGLVQVRNLNAVVGDDPSALVSRIEASCRRGDVSDALEAFAKLPEPSREAASAWASQAEARQAAEAALQSVREAAVARLAESAKP